MTFGYESCFVIGIALLASCAAVGKNMQAKPVAAKGLTVPVLGDLCQDPQEKAIRKKVKSAIFADSQQGGNLIAADAELIGCEDGRLRFLTFQLAKQSVLVVVQEDQRPARLSGGSFTHGFAMLDTLYVDEFATLWNKIGSKDKLSEQHQVNLMAAAIALHGLPDMIVNDTQRQAVVKAWPESENAFVLDPPGLSSQADALVLQAWIVHSYSERAVSCQYLDGWRVRFDPKVGVICEQNHAYASGSNLGEPCGKALPPAAK